MVPLKEGGIAGVPVYCFTLLIIGLSASTVAGNVVPTTGGAALSFDGADDFLVAFPAFNLESDWTLEAWVKPNPASVEKTQCLFSYTSFYGTHYLAVEAFDQVWRMRYGSDTIVVENATRAAFIGDRETHIAVTHEVSSNGRNARINIYINGTVEVQEARYTLATTDAEPLGYFLVGACAVPAPNGVARVSPFHGIMDEVREWSTVRDETTISAATDFGSDITRWSSAARFGGSLKTQYSFDDMDQTRVTDISSGTANTGLLGGGANPIDRPVYVTSPFTNLMTDQLNFKVRALDSTATTACPSERCVDMSEAQSNDGTTAVRGYQVIDMPNTPGLELIRFTGVGAAVPVSAGAILTDSDVLYISSPGPVASDSFTIQKCPSSGGACSLETITYGFEVLPSTAPFIGEAFSLQLLGNGGYLELPQALRGSATIQFWLRMDHTDTEQAVFSITQRSTGEPLVAFTYGAGGDLRFRFCTPDTPSTASPYPTTYTFSEPWIRPTEAHHISITMRRMRQVGVNADYNITIRYSCTHLATFTVTDTCAALDSADLLLPTFGQVYEVDRGSLVPSHFASMQMSDIRIWSRPITNEEFSCDAIRSEQDTDASGLQAYYPISRIDYIRTEPLLTSRPIRGIQGPAGIMRCNAARTSCPSIGDGRGYYVVPSVFSGDIVLTRPTYATTAGLVDGSVLPPLQLPMTTYDYDNWVRRTPTSRDLDQATIQILTTPSRVCGVLEVNNGSRVVQPNDTASPSELPLRFLPSNTLFCTTSFEFAAADTQGLDAANTSEIEIIVKQPGPELLSVEAFDPGLSDAGLDEGDIVAFFFDRGTNALLDWTSFVEVIDGTFGSAVILPNWNNAFTTLVLEILEPFDMNITPGLTSFRIKDDVDSPVQSQGVDSLPTVGTRVLSGSFSLARCSAGYVYRQNVADCLPCGPGNFDAADGVTCLPCPGGRFNPQDATRVCTACDVGTYLPPGSEDRTACRPADRGYFVSAAASLWQRHCPDGLVTEEVGSTHCLVCPLNADCDTSANTYAEPTLGFFRRPDDSFVRCPGGTGACRGWEPLANMSWLGSNKCAEGMHGLWCHSCLPGWYHQYDRPRGKCLECDWDHPARIAVVGGIESIGAWIMAFFAVHAAIFGHTHMVYLRMLLNYLTLVSVLGGIEQWELEPALGKDLADAASSILHVAFRYDGGILAQMLTLECIFAKDRTSVTGSPNEFDVQKNMLLFWIYVPLLWPMGVALLAVIIGELGYLTVGRRRDLSMALVTERSWGLFRRTPESKDCLRRWQMQLTDCVPLMLVTWLLALPTALKNMLVMLQCHRLTDSTDSVRLIMAPDIVCFEEEHEGWAALAVIGIFMWGFVAPGVLGSVMFYKRAAFKTGGFIRELLAYASEGFEYQYCFWDMVIQLRRVLIILVAVWPDLSRPQQIALYQVIGVGAIILHLKFDPFDNRGGRVLDEMELYGLSMFLLIVTIIQVVLLANPSSKYDLVPLLFALTIICLAFTLTSGLHFFRGGATGSTMKFGLLFVLTVGFCLLTCLVTFQDATTETEYDFRQMISFLLILFTVACNIFHILRVLVEVMGEIRRSFADAYMRRYGRLRKRKQEPDPTTSKGVESETDATDGEEEKPKSKRRPRTLMAKFEALMFKSEAQDQAYIHYDTANNELWLGLDGHYMYDKDLSAHTRRRLASMAPFLTSDERESFCQCIHDALSYIFVELDIDNFPCATLELVLRAPFVFKYMKTPSLEPAPEDAGPDPDAPATGAQSQAQPAPAAGASDGPPPLIPGAVPDGQQRADDAGVVAGEAVQSPAVAIGYPAAKDAEEGMTATRNMRRQAFFMDAVLGADMTIAEFTTEINALTHLTKQEFKGMLQEYLEDRTTQQLVQRTGLL